MKLHYRSEFGILLPKSAQELLLNMTVGNGDMSIPSVYHYLPHLIGKPSSLKPAVKLSKGRAGGKCFSVGSSVYFFFVSLLFILLYFLLFVLLMSCLYSGHEALCGLFFCCNYC